MKNMLRAAIVALSFASIGSAYAGAGDRPAPNTQFTEIPGILAGASVQDAPSLAMAQNGPVIQTYVTNANRGTWLFRPNQNQGNGS
jgi:hypothetical protein